ncbi:histone-lysine N-methyltransferase SETMAR-like [Ruditapes philippinarum]|uniref:histone-lysine N-methyltransferase SETMAR-like n=1 Tax=Ruditapes philippinarum TaxID=129788 RepID=UPI00295AE461|nr:histone-lysine N-methyltransferase SETMAR-like [Ruditapes philippinarum]
MTPTQTLHELQATDKYKSVSKSLVFKWHKRFVDGWTEEQRGNAGRPREFDDRLIQSVTDAIKEDRRLTIREVALISGCSKSTVHRILHENLNMSRVCAGWVPRLLSNEEKETRVRLSTEFLRRHEIDQQFLSKIVSVDETWLHYYDPEDKRQSSVWKTAASPPPKKAKVTKSMGKHMFIVFIDRKGVLLCHAVPLGQTVNSAYYSKVIRRDLLNAIRKKRPAFN